MKKFLIFRTDRIGDFILSSIVIKSIKRNEPSSYITIICSEKNYSYVKKLSFVDHAIEYPSSFVKKIIFFYKILTEKNDSVICLDGKKRSIFACGFSRANFKIISVTKKIYKNIFFKIKKNVISTSDFNSKIDEFKTILNRMNYSFSNEDLNIFDSESIIASNDYLRNISLKTYNLLHLDEKWITEEYQSKKGSRNFKSINPTIEDLYEFLKKIVIKTNNDLLISSGFKNNKLIEGLKTKFKLKNSIDYNNKKITILENLSFFDLKFVIKKANLIITCHGSPSHVASAFNTKIIDIFDEGTKDFYHYYTKHLRNYQYVFRDDFKVISNKILQIV